MKGKDKCFCTKCKKFVEYNISDCILEGKVKEKTYKYKGKQAKCKLCSSLVFVPKINDENLESLYETYRKENDIVSLDVVRDLPHKYNIGKRPLSRLLNWGELTYSRFVDGDVPSIKYSEMINRLYYDPSYFNGVLEDNKSKIENVTYKKCKTAVNKVLKINENKIYDVAEYILFKSNYDITHLAMQKLLYYIQGFYYAFNSEFLFLDDCQARIHGPVFENIYHKYKENSYHSIKRNRTFDMSKLTKKEINVIDGVIKNLGCFGGETLRILTHSEKPWKQTRKGLSSNQNCKRIINKELIGNYFKELVKEYKITSPKEICNYSYKIIKNN